MKNTNKLIPLFDRVVLRPVQEHQSNTGIYIPRDTTERSRLMIVTATGKEVTSVRIGDKAIVAKYAGTEVCFQSEKVHIVTECDILAVLE